MISPIAFASEIVPVGMRAWISSLAMIQPAMPAFEWKARAIGLAMLCAITASWGSAQRMWVMLPLSSAIASGLVAPPLMCDSSVSSPGTARPAASASSVGSPVISEISIGTKVLNAPISTGIV